MISLPQLLSDYFRSGKAIPAFNIDSLEIFQAVELAVRETHLPCIVQLTANEDKFVTAEKLYLLVKKANLDNLPIYLNMDHSTSPSRLFDLSKLGFDMVHFDGSSLPITDNLSKSCDLVESVHPRSLVEVEIDRIAESNFTVPDIAKNFITDTKADLLAVSIGNRHGNDPSFPEKIDLDLLAQIHDLLPETFLTLHGGSGVPLSQIKEAIKLGVVKININTDLRQAFLSSLRSEISTNSTEKIYELFTPVVSAVSAVAKQKLIEFYET